jgi:hypothetical protein
MQSGEKILEKNFLYDLAETAFACERPPEETERKTEEKPALDSRAIPEILH